MKIPAVLRKTATLLLALSGLLAGSAFAQTTLNPAGDTRAGTAPAAGGMTVFEVTLSPGHSGLRLLLATAGSGDADLYIQAGAGVGTDSYLKRSIGSPGSDTLVLTESATPGLYTIGIHRPTGQSGTLSYTLHYEAAWSTTVNWDAGDGALALARDLPAQVAQDVYFRTQVPASGSLYGALYAAISANDGGAARLYAAAGAESLPDTDPSVPQSTLAGPNGLVLNEGQFSASQTWVFRVRYTPGAVPDPAPTLTCRIGEPVVQDLGAVSAVEGANSGDLVVGPEGIAFFRATVPAGTPAWALWARTNAAAGQPLSNLSSALRIRRLKVPTDDAYSELRSTFGQMLVVPDYLNASGDTYFLSVTTTAGTRLNLASYRQPTPDLASFTTPSEAVSFTNASFLFKTYRVTVPVQQIGWDLTATSSSGNLQLATRRGNIPNAFNNDAFAEAPAGVQDSVSLAQPDLADGVWYVTVYTDGNPAVGSFRSGPPQLTDTTFVSTQTNDLSAKSGWRFYRVTDLASQLGHLGWEILLTTPVENRLLALRANGLPVRRQYRQNDGTGVYTSDRFDYSSALGDLQRPGHQADIWYIGVYRPDDALGAFALQTKLLTAETKAFESATSITGQPAGLWRYFRVDVPASSPGLLGWDLRLDNITGGNPRFVIRRDQLPGDFSTTGGWSWPIGGSVTYLPAAGDAWPSGHQWTSGNDLSGYVTDADGTDRSDQFLLLPLGRPLQPGTYYIGVSNAPSTSASLSYTFRARGVWAPGTTGVTGPVAQTLAFSGAGNSATVASLAPRDTTYYKVTVPAGQPSWQLRLSATTGDVVLAVRHLSLPSLSSVEDGYGSSVGGFQHLETGVLMRKSGDEHYTLLPTYADSGAGLVTTVPAGDYLVSVTSQGATDIGVGNRLGSDNAAFTLTSVGTAPVFDLGALSSGGPALTRADTLQAGQLGFYRFTVPAGLPSLQVRLSDRVGHPWLALATTPGQLPLNNASGYYTGQSAYGYGLDQSGPGGASLRTADYATIPNPAAGTYYISVRASRFADGSGTQFPDAAFTVRVESLDSTVIAFDGGTATVASQPTNTWRYFKVVVPSTPGLLGWDLRLDNITGGQHRLLVRRDLLPEGLSTTGGWVWPLDASTTYLPPAGDAWPSGHQWAGEADLTGYTLDADGTDRANQFLLLALGRPLQPGTYTIGVADSPDQPSADGGYTLRSRGIWAPGTTGVSGPVVQTLAFTGAGNTATVASLAPRQTAYYRVTVPAGQPSWQLRLAATTGDVALAVRHLSLPSLSSTEGGYGNGIGGVRHLEAGVLMRKTGHEHYTLLPTYQDSGSVTTIPAGDYLVSVVSQGGADVGAGGRLGSGDAAFTLTSVGAAPVFDLGTLTLGGPALTRSDALQGGQIGFYRFTAPAGLTILEAEISDRVGYPWLALANNPGQLPQNTTTSYLGLDSGGLGGVSTSSTGLITVPNPTDGTYYLSVRAGYGLGIEGYSYADATYSLRVEAPGPSITPVGFDGGEATVSGQPADTFRYFQIEVPAGASGLLGWDLRLDNITGGHPRIVVRRDLLPTNLSSTGGFVWPLGASTTYWAPAADAWPSGHQWAGESDLTGYALDADGTDRAGQFLLMPLGRPLQPGTYYVGVSNASGETATLGYTLRSRAVWAPGTAGVSGPVAQTLAFTGAGNSATVAALAPRETAFYKVVVPAGQPSWQLRLAANTGDLALAVRQAYLPSLSSYESGYSSGAHYLETGVLVRKTGHEHYTLLPTYQDGGSGPVTAIPAGTYYLSVTAQGVDGISLSGRLGTGDAAFTLTSVGPAPVVDLGTVPAGGVAALTRSDALEAGQVGFYRFTLPAGFTSLELQLGDRVGFPVLALATAAGFLPTPYNIAGAYGLDSSGLGAVAFASTGYLTVPNPAAGTYYLSVRAGPAGGGLFPDATFSLRLRENVPQALNVSSTLNGNGLNHAVTASLGDGQRATYRIEVPATLGGQPVLAWTPRLTLASGTVSWWIKKGYPASAYDPTQIAKSGAATAVLAPPFLTPGTWYIEVLGSGVATFTLTNTVAALQRLAWSMPAIGQPVATPGLAGTGSLFADTGVRTDGTPLPDPELGTVTDQGTDLAQGDYHYYAFTVPAANAGLIHVELIAINGNPDLFIRPQTLPSDDAGATAPLHRLEGTGTEYAAFVPSTSRTSLALEAGTWYVAVKATGGTNARYRLRLNHGNPAAAGQVQALALDGGAYTGQLLAAGDWRYYRVDLPAATPASWQLTYSQQQGDVDLFVRDTLPPGFHDSTSLSAIRDWSSDNKNQGPYASYPATGTHALPAAILRPGHTYYLGFRANTDASFSLNSVIGGSAPVPPDLAFYGGSLSNVPLAAGASLTYRIAIPADGWRWKSSASSTGALDWFLEEGAPVDFARLGVVAAHAQYPSSVAWSLNQPLFDGAWPWLPSRTFYLTVRNSSGGALAFSFTMNGKSAATDDEDTDGLPDAWETASYGGLSYTTYGPASDPDGDGIPNLLEYALALDPLAAGSAGLPIATVAGGNLTLTYKRARAGLTYTVQTTTDLAAGSWTATGVTQGTPAGDGTTTASIPLGPPLRFLRLHVTVAP